MAKPLYIRSTWYGESCHFQGRGVKAGFHINRQSHDSRPIEGKI